MHNRITRELVSVSLLLSGSAEVSLCCREAEEKGKESVHCALSIFRLLLILLGYPAGAFAKERGRALLKKKRDFKAVAFFPFFSLSPFPPPSTQAIQMVASLDGDVKPFTLSPSSLHIWPQISIQWIVQLVSLIVIHWILINPVDKAIQSLNNWGQL